MTDGDKNKKGVFSARLSSKKISIFRTDAKNQFREKKCASEPDYYEESIQNSYIKYCTHEQLIRIKNDANRLGIIPIQVLVNHYFKDPDSANLVESIERHFEDENVIFEHKHTTALNSIIYIKDKTEELEAKIDNISQVVEKSIKKINSMSNTAFSANRQTLSSVSHSANECDSNDSHKYPVCKSERFEDDYEFSTPRTRKTNYDPEYDDNLPSDHRINIFKCHYHGALQYYDSSAKADNIHSKFRYLLPAACIDYGNAQYMIAVYLSEITEYEPPKSSYILLVSLAWFIIARDNKTYPLNTDNGIGEILHERISKLYGLLDEQHIKEAEYLSKVWPTVYPWPRHFKAYEDNS